MAQFKLLLSDSPSLKSYLDDIFLTAYELGLALAIRETRLGDRIFLEERLYTTEQALNANFFPDSSSF